MECPKCNAEMVVADQPHIHYESFIVSAFPYSLMQGNLKTSLKKISLASLRI